MSQTHINLFTPSWLKASTLAVAILNAGCGVDDTKTSAAQSAAIPAQIITPVRESVTLWDNYIGRFEAMERVEIRPRVSGYLQKVHFEPGRSVSKGDLLVTIDARPFKAEITRIEAEIAQAKSRQALAESQSRRAKTLLDARAGSQEEYEETLQSKESAKGEIAAARARLERAKLDLEFTRIRSPITGRVGEDFINAGNLVSETQTLLTTVVSMDPMYFAFTGSEQDFLNYSRLSQMGKRGSSRDEPNPVRIRLTDSDEYNIEGKMAFLDNTIDQNTATISARAIVDNSDGFLTPGMFGQLRLYGRDPFQALVIPEKLIQYDQSRAFVWRLGPDDKARRAYLTPGRTVEGERIIIEDGLSAEDRIVASNVLAMRPGTLVSPLLNTQ